MKYHAKNYRKRHIHFYYEVDNVFLQKKESMSKVRVRFAPSPTGPLHIGGVRTALYNYLFAKKHGGDFILRIEDTDQTRYVEGAEDYIMEALEWLGLDFDESPKKGGDVGPYRQSERKDMYRQYAERLVEEGKAYYAFDSSDELNEMRAKFTAQGVHSPKYDASTRMTMKNSLTLDASEVNELLKGDNVIIRLLVDPDMEVIFNDEIRGQVTFNTSELDDKVLLKADGMPTYHMANIVDDHLMEISHVIRGEEWLSSTAHHVMLYRALGWADTMPKFAHLPLILKPVGNGKLSKRDGAKFGFPVFPLSWNGEKEDDHFIGFKEFGFDAAATLNFLAFVGWNPGTEQELFSLDELVDSFSMSHIVKSGARFDIDKAKWFNQQYIIKKDTAELLPAVKDILTEKGVQKEDEFLIKYINLMKERVTLLPEFYSKGQYVFGDIVEYEEKIIRKKWKGDNIDHFKNIINIASNIQNWNLENLQSNIKGYITENELSFGNVLPFLRVASTGTTKGPDVFEMMDLLGKDLVVKRMGDSIEIFDKIVA